MVGRGRTIDFGDGFVLEGEYVVYVEDRETVCGPGSFVFVPLGAPHTFRTGAVPGRKLNFYFRLP